MPPPRIAAGTPVLFDASPLRRFSEADVLAELMLFLKNAAITDVVASEVDEAIRLGIRGTGPLRAMRAATAWPAVHVTPPELFKEALVIQKSQGSTGRKDLGEITTVLVAQHLGGLIVVAEDSLAKRLCRARRLARVPTALLAVDMHLSGSLSEDDAREVFRISTPPDVPSSDFRRYAAERE